MRSAPRLVLAVVAVPALTACGFADAPPHGAVIVCAGDADCPHGERCDASGHVCALPGAAVDVRAPAVVSAVFDPPFASSGTVTLTINADEALAGAPVLAFDGVDDPGFGAGVVDGSTARFTLDASAVAPGAYPLFAVTIADSAGNSAQRLTPGVVLVVDRRAPVILDLAVQHADATAPLDAAFSAQSGFDAMTITFAVDEGVDDADVTVTAGTQTTPDGVVCVRVGGGSSFSCRTAVTTEAFTDVSDRVAVHARDRAGNAGDTSVNVRVDLSPPVVVDALTTLEKPGGGVTATAVSGGQVHIDLVTNEVLGAAPTLSVSSGDAALGSVVATQLDQVRWSIDGTFSFVGAATPSASLAVFVGDAVGNGAPVSIGDVPLGESVTSPCPALLPTACHDFDGDGAFAIESSCTAGTDCDDTDPLIGAGLIEIAGDGKDNDCAGDGDLAVDEASGVFADAAAPAGGDGSRANPYRTLDEAIANAGLHPFIFLAASNDYSVGAAGEAAPSIIGGFDPSTWTLATGARSLIVFPDGPANLSDGSDRVFAHLELQSPDGTSIQIAGRADLVDVEAHFNVDLVFERRAIISGGHSAPITFRAGAAASVLAGALLDDEVTVETGGSVLINAATTGDHGTVSGESLIVESGARALVINSSMGAMVCHACTSLEVWSSVVFGPGNATTAITIDPGSGEVFARNDIFMWRAPPANAALIAGDVSSLTIEDTLIDSSVPAVLLRPSGGADVTSVVALNDCASATPACAASSGNIAGFALLGADDVHVELGSAAAGAGTLTGLAAIPEQLAADVDGNCRSRVVVDVGADESPQP